MPLEEHTDFKSDRAKTAGGRNNALIRQLGGKWNPLDIVRIDRFDDDVFSGWEATYTVETEESE